MVIAIPASGCIELDSHGNALHDLGEVAGCILRRDHAEDCTRAGGKTQDMAAGSSLKMVPTHSLCEGVTESK
jgi:hypothetical protein